MSTGLALQTTCTVCKRPYEITREALLAGYVSWTRCPDCRRALAKANRAKLDAAKEAHRTSPERAEDELAAASLYPLDERGEIGTVDERTPVSGALADQGRRGDLHRGAPGERSLTSSDRSASN